MIKGKLKGALVIEAAIIFPFIIAIILSLVYFCMIKLELGIIDNICTCYGYKIISENELSGINVYETDKSISEKNEIYFNDIEPYADISDNKIKIYQSDLKKKVDENSFVRGNSKVIIEESRYAFTKILTIDVKYNYEMPGFIEYFNINIGKIHVVKTFCDIDKNDLVRNTEYVYEIGDDLFEKFKIKDKLKKFGVFNDEN